MAIKERGWQGHTRKRHCTSINHAEQNLSSRDWTALFVVWLQKKKNKAKQNWNKQAGKQRSAYKPKKNILYNFED